MSIRPIENNYKVQSGVIWPAPRTIVSIVTGQNIIAPPTAQKHISDDFYLKTTFQILILWRHIRGTFGRLENDFQLENSDLMMPKIGTRYGGKTI